MGPAPVVVDDDGLAVPQGRLSGAAGVFAALPSPLRGRADDAVEAVGEFSGDLREGAAAFALSWTAALDAYAECGSLLAADVGASSLQLQQLEAAAVLVPASTLQDLTAADREERIAQEPVLRHLDDIA